jgi:hypothetical protein
MDVTSPGQIAGYAAMALGVTAFLQKNDKRLLRFNAMQGLAYALHFFLLGNLPASSSSLISSARSFLALRYRSARLAWAIVAVFLLAGVAFVRDAAGALPVIGACVATVALFTMQGIPLRLVLLFGTVLWLVNNILSHSIGGTVLELFIGGANISTIVRLSREKPAQPEPEESTLTARR